jgi:CheY-like chemotaxis protein
MRESRHTNILILEPERDMCDLFSRVIEGSKCCRCYMASTGGEACDLVRDISFDLILVDLHLAMAGDFSLLKRLRHLSPHALIVADAYLHQKQHINKAVELGAYAHIIKPIKVEALRKKIDEFYAALQA